MSAPPITKNIGKDRVLKWIKDSVEGKTFIDVGGIWNTVNEKVTAASLFGASEVAMADIISRTSSYGEHQWRKFRQRCEEYDVVCNHNISADIESLDFVNRVPQFDVVHCAGTLYHCANPIHSLCQLHKITRKHLILGSTRIPANGTDRRFPIFVPDGGTLLSTNMTHAQIEICKSFYGFKGNQGGWDTPISKWPNNTENTPWWYFFTDGYLESILEICGFKIVDKYFYWKKEQSNLAVYYLTERVHPSHSLKTF